MNRALSALPAFVALVTAACASSSTASSDVTTSTRTAQTLSVAGGGSGNSMRINAESNGPTIHAVPAAIDRVWRVMPAAFDSLGVPVTRVDQSLKIIGNEGFKIRQKLRNTPLSRYIDCGTTQIGPNADSYEVFMVLLVQVKPAANAAGSSQIFTTFEASARPLTFSQGYTRCTTSTALETRLLAAVNAQLK